VCLFPGTEIAFEKEVKYERFFVLFPSMEFGKLGKKVAQFRQINMGKLCVHHDALEFPDGETVLLHPDVRRPARNRAAAAGFWTRCERSEVRFARQVKG